MSIVFYSHHIFPLPAISLFHYFPMYFHASFLSFSLCFLYQCRTFMRPFVLSLSTFFIVNALFPLRIFWKLKIYVIQIHCHYSDCPSSWIHSKLDISIFKICLYLSVSIVNLRALISHYTLATCPLPFLPTIPTKLRPNLMLLFILIILP